MSSTYISGGHGAYVDRKPAPRARKLVLPPTFEEQINAVQLKLEAERAKRAAAPPSNHKA
jgi:hypothetical protein